MKLCKWVSSTLFSVLRKRRNSEHGQMHQALDKVATSWLCVNGWICNFHVTVASQCAVPYLGHKKAVTRAKAPRCWLQVLLFIYNNRICGMQSGLVSGWQLQCVVCSSLISYRLLPCCSAECSTTVMAGLNTAVLS